ncbi:MAG: hypothetical protein IJO33_02795 [Bacilli bacterium]|nr:hypothetical protein [Bacilli bacterium]
MRKLNYLSMFVITLLALTINVNAISNSTDLSDCISGTESICKITSDFTMADPITITGGREVTIDLNSHTLDVNSTIVLNGSGILTITGNGKITTDTAGYMFDVYPGTTLILENGTFTNTSNGGKIIGVTGSETDSDPITKAAAVIKEAASLSANYGIVVRHAGNNASYGAVVELAGTINAINGNNGYNDGSVGIFVNGNIKKDSGNIPVINITGGEITTTVGTTGVPAKDSAPALSASGYAKWNISAGDITGTEAAAIKAGEFNITGGNFTATGEYYDPASGNYNGSEATGAAISITATKNYSNNVKINISGATFTSKNGNALYEGISTDKDGNKTTTSSSLVEGGLLINGGTFIAEDTKKPALDIDKNVKEFISGGEFSSNVIEDYINKNVESSKQEDGSYIVGTRYTITVKETVEGTVRSDKNTAINGETVTLTIISKEGYKLKSVTANEIEVKDNKFIMPNENVEIKVEFEKIVLEKQEKEELKEDSNNTEVKEEPKTEEKDSINNVDNNPTTGDNFILYGLLIIVSIFGFKFSLTTKKNN